MFRQIFAIIISSLITMMVSAAANDTIRHNYTFTGENEFWTAELTAKMVEVSSEKNGKLEYHNESREYFIITYKKDIADLTDIKNLKIAYKTNFSKSELSENYTDGGPREKTHKLQSGSNGGAIIKKDEIIKVTVTIDGKVQTFPMTYKQTSYLQGFSYLLNRLFVGK